jgi:predicted RNase H-like nuclease
METEITVKQQSLIEEYVQAYNQFDIDGMLKNLHPELVFENVSGGQVTLSTKGLEAFKTQAESAVEYFSKREQRITEFSFHQDQVEVNIDYTAVLVKDLPIGLKKGDTLKMQGKSVFVFEGGKIFKITDES